ncbi:hypothetical protein D1007_59488 [Hordeum vulgare]|nr:hypothetical protein D1007_59488 [Hordeum vulgare]
MLHRLRGHSSFFVLAEPAPSDPSSPTVLSRLSRGLLVRAAAASRVHDLFFARALLFTATPASPTPDALTLAEPLLADLDAFVAAMDEISGGAFLCAVPSGAGACPTCGGPAGRKSRGRGWVDAVAGTWCSLGVSSRRSHRRRDEGDAGMVGAARVRGSGGLRAARAADFEGRGRQRSFSTTSRAVTIPADTAGSSNS